MNQVDIQMFLAIVHNHNFSKTAEAMFTSQTVVSHRMSALEKELGYPLFVRRPGMRTVELTHQGQQFVPLAEQWEALWSASQSLGSRQYRSPLFIGAGERLNAHVLPPFYRLFSSKRQDTVQLNIRTYHSLETISLVEQKKLDIGLTSSDPNMKDIITVPVLYEPLVMICRPSGYYPEGPISPEDLDPDTGIQMTSNATISTWRSRHWGESYQPSISVDTYSLAASLMSSEIHWATCPKLTAEAMAKANSLEIHPFSVDVPYQATYLIYRQNISIDKQSIILDFLNSFREYFKS